MAVAFAKQAVNRAFETTLVEGVRHERALFMSLFGTPRSARGDGGVRGEAEAGVPVGVASPIETPTKTPPQIIEYSAPIGDAPALATADSYRITTRTAHLSSKVPAERR